MNILDVTDVACTRGHRKLFTNLSFTVAAGTALYVQGANGSGKTTLLRAVCGLLQPQDGTISWNGLNIHAIREDYARMMLYQGHLDCIKLDLTGIENLRIAATLSGCRVQVAKLWEILQQVGLAGVEDLPCRMLSQGQRRRVALARLFISQAKLWILDEPFVGLDKAAVELILSLMAQHLSQGGLVLFSTHQEVTLPSGTMRVLKLGGGRSYV